MASNTVFKTERNSGFHDNDPLAELTRIMGYDTRNHLEASPDIDFGIDLEKELLGELESDQPAVESSRFAAPRAEVAPPVDFDEEFDGAFAELFEDDVAQGAQDNLAQLDTSGRAEDMSRADVWQAPEPEIEAPAEAQFDEPDFFSDRDMAESLAEAEAPEVLHGTHYAPEPTLELSLEDELQALLGEAPAAPATAASRADLAATEAVPEEAADASLDGWNPRADDEWAGDAESELTPDHAPDRADWMSHPSEPFAEAATAAAASPVAAPASIPSGYTEADQADADAADDLEAAIAAFADDDRWVEPEPRAAMAADAELRAPAEVDFADMEADAAAELESSMEAWEPDFSDSTEVHTDYNAFASSDDAEIEAGAAAPAGDAAEEERMAEAHYVEPEAVADMDPFAALAALAAAPPVLKAFSRTNPVAVQPSWDRPAARSASTPTAPVARTAEPAPAYAPPAYAPPASAPAASAPAAFAQPAYTAPVPPSAPTQSVAATPSGVVDAIDIGDFSELMEARDRDDFAPEIDTVDVPDEIVALAEELDIPDLAQDEPVPMADEYDNLESEFASAFSQLTSDEAAAEWQPPRSGPDGGLVDVAYQDALDRIDVASAGIAAGHADPQQPRGVDPRYHAAASADRHDVHLAGDGAYDANDPFMVDNSYDGSAVVEPVRPVRNRGLMIAAIVAAVAVAGGIGAFALSFGGSDNGGAPILVKADPSPVKVKPETPGGVVVPNQDGKVYEQVAGQPAATPTQEKLVTGAEEPIMPAVAAPVAASTAPSEPLPGVAVPQVKAEDRVAQEAASAAAQDPEIAAVAPRKVRTMIVRPDGTLVAREDPAPEAAPAAPAISAAATEATPTVGAIAPVVAPQAAEPAPVATAPAEPAPAATATEVAALPPPEAPAAAEPAPVVPAPKPVAATAAEPVAAPRPAPAAAVPAPAPRPAEQPVELAGGAATATAGTGFWNVQIASQPTREGAQASYEDLARRYGAVLGGKGVNIVQAEIPNKGTFWRVRIPAASKSDANILCAKLKTAGGSCFVSK